LTKEAKILFIFLLIVVLILGGVSYLIFSMFFLYLMLYMIYIKKGSLTLKSNVETYTIRQRDRTRLQYNLSVSFTLPFLFTAFLVSPYYLVPASGEKENKYQHKLLLRRVDSDLHSQKNYELLHQKALESAGLIIKNELSEIEEKTRIIEVASSCENTILESKIICPAPFKFLVIDMEGDVFFCWKDKKKELKLGNLHTETLKKLFSSKKYYDFINSHYRKSLQNYSLCEKCNGFDIAPLTEWELKEIGKNLNGYKIIVTKSTVPVGTNRKLKKIIADNDPDDHEFDIVSNPEFLREGSAIHDFFHPDRVVIGV
jgi:radical SAM protein with 4Fe4S-binding SPASM domain